MGRPALNDELLDSAAVSRVLLFPHFSSRGPNGMLELRRGANHPLEIRARDRRAYVLRTQDGILLRECYATRLGSECELIPLFSTMKQARQHAADERDTGDLDLQPSLIEGTALLDALSYADAVDVHKPNGDIDALVLTHMGRVIFGEHDELLQTASADQVFDALTKSSTS